MELRSEGVPEPNGGSSAQGEGAEVAPALKERPPQDVTKCAPLRTPAPWLRALLLPARGVRWWHIDTPDSALVSGSGRLLMLLEG